MTILKPKPIKKGDCIGVVSLSHYIRNEHLEKAKAFIENQGYTVFLHPQTRLRHHRQAGTLKDRINALHDVFKDERIDAIMVSSGGNRALHLLDHINYDIIKNNPKIFCGYSDTTALLNAFHAKTGLVTFQGTDLGRLTKDNENITQHFKSFEDVCSGLYPYQYPMTQAKILKPGHACGHLIGGNLTLIQNLLKTDYLSSTDDKIIFIEDEKETLWNLDRMLLFMKRLGYFKNCRGLVVGGFSESVDYKEPTPSFGYSLEDLILEHCGQDYDFPIVIKAPFGHIGAMETIPIGIKAELIADHDRISFELTEPAVIGSD